MKALVIGGTGTIGRAVAAALSPRHEVIAAARTRADYTVDIDSARSIRELFQRTGRVDAVVSCAGNAAFRPLLDR